MQATAPGIRVWDIVVRVLHWSLVAFFFIAYLSGDDESLLHAYAGYGVLAIVAARVLWGFVGTKHARFADFIYGPAHTLRYARSMLSGKSVRYLGHNPLGGWMVVTLLLVLAAACWTGLEAYAVEGRGPLAAREATLIATAAAGDADRREHRGEERSRNKANGGKFWEEAHEALSHLALFLVFLHVAGVLAASALHRENLIKAMVTGVKQPDRSA